MADIAQITATQAYQTLAEDAGAVLVDVRTEAEWAFVGIPDIAEPRRILLSWQVYPGMGVDPKFVDRLTEALGGATAQKDKAVLFLCRSGGRSMAAAMAMADAGFTGCVNISDGFEGNLDAQRHRGRTDGWKAAGLPWVQS